MQVVVLLKEWKLIVTLKLITVMVTLMGSQCQKCWGGPESLKLYFDEHLAAPNIDAYYVSPQDYNSQNLASIYAPKVTLTNSGGQSEEWYAEMYAPTQSFVEGTGDDNDVYTAFDISGISFHEVPMMIYT